MGSQVSNVERSSSLVGYEPTGSPINVDDVEADARSKEALPGAAAGIVLPAHSDAFFNGVGEGMSSTQNGSIDRAALCPLTDVLIRRHGWRMFDFRIRDDMAARTSGKIDWSKSLAPKAYAVAT